MKNTLQYDKKQAEFHRFVNDSFETLKRLRKEDRRQAFNELLLKVLPDIKRYITRGLRIALEKGVISHNKFEPEDLFDQLIIDVYDHLEEVRDKEEFHAWLFRRAEKLLEDMEVEEEFESYFYDNIDDYSKPELVEMREAFSTDGDGDLVMMEELDDISYKNHHYILKNIFLDDAHEDLMALMDTDKEQTRAERHLESALFQLPPNMRSVFELATEQLFSIEDIARIKGVSADRVEKTLERARELLQNTLEDRFYES